MSNRRPEDTHMPRCPDCDASGRCMYVGPCLSCACARARSTPAPSMKDRLNEKLTWVRSHLASVGTTPLAFYNDPDFESLDFEHEYERESFAHAWGYIEGAADMADKSIPGLLEQHGLQLDPPKRRARPLCPKCGSKSHRCKTGGPGCRHCDDEKCGHGWHQQ